MAGFAAAKPYGYSQFLNWLSFYATGIEHLNGFESHGTSIQKERNITNVMFLVRVTGFDGWLCCGKAIWLQPVFELVAAKCHWHLAFKWVRILS